MTKPSIRTHQESTVASTSGTTRGPITIPAGAVVGDLLVCQVCCRTSSVFASQTYTFPAGWTQLTGAYNYDGSRKSFDIWSKVCAAGDAGSTFNITSSSASGAQKFGACVLAIQGVKNAAATYILSAGSFNTFTGGSPFTWGSPTFSPSWGAVDELELVFAVSESNSLAGGNKMVGGGNGYTQSVFYGVDSTSSGMPCLVDYLQEAVSPTTADSGTAHSVGFCTQISIVGVLPGGGQALFM